MPEKKPFGRILDVVRTIPAGKVATYGQVAVLAGNPTMTWARAVGYALHSNPEPGVIPCHRVVSKAGHCAASFGFGGAAVQRRLLELEGVAFTPEGCVDLERCAWDGVPAQTVQPLTGEQTELIEKGRLGEFSA
jgi:methylated-DNA-protein-cysteine methyltransferase-like protein